MFIICSYTVFLLYVVIPKKLFRKIVKIYVFAVFLDIFLGEKKLGIPKLKPLIIPEVSIETNLLKMKASTVLVSGADTAEIQDI